MQQRAGVSAALLVSAPAVVWLLDLSPASTAPGAGPSPTLFRLPPLLEAVRLAAAVAAVATFTASEPKPPIHVATLPGARSPRRARAGLTGRGPA